MQITPVDHEHNLFAVSGLLTDDLVDQILNTPWLDLPWQRQEGQERWARRRIQDHSLPWLDAWNQQCRSVWPDIAQAFGTDIHDYGGTAWWLDEPGFTCSLHTDGELPGSLHMMWVGALPTLGTAFYDFKNPEHLRHQFEMQVNTGYIMVNQPDAQGTRRLQWHGMLTPVPENTFRLTSYTWITPR